MTSRTSTPTSAGRSSRPTCRARARRPRRSVTAISSRSAARTRPRGSPARRSPSGASPLALLDAEHRDRRAGAAGVEAGLARPPPRPRRAGPAGRRPRPPRGRRARRPARAGAPVATAAALRHDRHACRRAARPPRCSGSTSGSRRPRLRSASISAHSSWRTCGSRPTVGSSSSTSRGWCTSARAISSRRRMPPESLSTFVSRRSLRLRDRERALDRRAALARAGPGRGGRTRAGSARR